MNSRFFVLQFSVLFTVMLLLSFLSQFKHVGLIMLPAFFFTVVGTLFPSLYVLKSVSREIRVTPHLWLHSPRSAWMLLSSKLFIGMFGMILILLLNIGFISWGLSSFYPSEKSGAGSIAASLFLSEIGMHFSLIVLSISLYLAVCTILAIMVNFSVKNIFGPFYWLAGLGVFVMSAWILVYLSKGLVRAIITQWRIFKMYLSTVSSGRDFFGQITYGEPIGIIILIAIGAFALSTWLLDHKVEV